MVQDREEGKIKGSRLTYPGCILLRYNKTPLISVLLSFNCCLYKKNLLSLRQMHWWLVNGSTFSKNKHIASFHTCLLLSSKEDFTQSGIDITPTDTRGERHLSESLQTATDVLKCCKLRVKQIIKQSTIWSVISVVVVADGAALLECSEARSILMIIDS